MNILINILNYTLFNIIVTIYLLNEFFCFFSQNGLQTWLNPIHYVDGVQTS